jgi:hypothetical protein
MGAVREDDQDVLRSGTRIGSDDWDFLAEQGVVTIVDARVAGFMSSM